MKKSLWLPVFLFLCFMAFPAVAFAGDINSAESDIISLINNEFDYMGKIYKVEDSYIPKVVNYLSREDVDLTQSEVNDYIGQFYSNFTTGISRGYLVAVRDSAPPASSSQQTAGQPGAEAAGTEETEMLPESTLPDGAEGLIVVPEPESIAPEDMPKVIQDNTTGATAKGEVEYSVSPVEPTTMYVWDTETLNVRKEAYQASERVGTLAKGDAVTVIGAATTGWAQIEFEGDVAYVSANYLVTEGFRNKELGITPEEETQTTDAETTDEAEEGSTQAPETGTEVVSQETVSESAETESEIEGGTETEPQEKDYSDAEPMGRSVNVAAIAAVIAVIFLLVFGGIVLWHNSKSRKNRKK